MKTVYLIRHAKSSWSDLSLEDFERPLNARGKRDAPLMGKHLHQLQLSPDMVLSSPAKRAAKTARKIIKKLDYSVSNIIFKDELYHASWQQLLHHLQQTPDVVDTLMLFGHNPGLTNLANILCSTSIDNIVTCGVYAISFEVDSWKEIRADQAGELLFYEYPKKLR